MTALSLTLTCSALQQNNVVETVDFIGGTEALSTPYTFEVTFTTSSLVTNPSSIIGQNICLTITPPGQGTLVVAGVVFSLIGGDQNAVANYVYRAVVTPRFKLLDLNIRNQVYGTGPNNSNALTLPNLIDAVLGSQTAASSAYYQSSINKTSSVTVSYNCTPSNSNSYTALDYIVQYGESDLAFLSRRCEAAGMFYFFQQPSPPPPGSSSIPEEEVLFRDSNLTFASGGDLDYAGQQQSNAPSSDYPLTSFCCVSQVLPAAVDVCEYNYQSPPTAAPAAASPASINGGNYGNVVEYQQTTLGNGTTLAKLHAGEIGCRGTVYRGISSAPQLRPGYVFTLQNYDPSINGQTFLVTKVTHRVGTPVGYGQDANTASQSYQNEFEAIPNTVAYVPPRVTPRPVISGLMSATIDSSTNGERADVDSTGRYLVRLYCDERDTAVVPDGSWSGYVRKATPYAGANNGMDFPLLKGTEVLLSFIQGDPDRPIIVGAAYAGTSDIVNNSNETRNRILTPTQVAFEIDDGVAAVSPPQNFARINVPGAATSYLRLGVVADNDATAATTRPDGSQQAAGPWYTGLAPTNTTPSITNFSSAQVQNDGTAQNWQSTDAAQAVYNDTPNTNTVGTASQYTQGAVIGTNQNLITNVGQAALTLIGAGATTQVTTNDHNTSVQAGAIVAYAQQGIYMTAGDDQTHPSNIELHAYGYVKTESEGNGYVWSHGNTYTEIDGNKYQTVHGTYSTFTDGDYISTIWGRSNSYVMGGRLQMLLGPGLLMALALDLKILMPGEIKLVFGSDIKLILGTDIKICQSDIKVLTTGEIKFGPNDTRMTMFKTIMKQVALDYTQVHSGGAVLRNGRDVLKAGYEGVCSIISGIRSHLPG